MLISRQEAMHRLGIRSRTTLSSYCSHANIPPRLRLFTEAEFERIKAVRYWCARGGRLEDFSRYEAINSTEIA